MPPRLERVWRTAPADDAAAADLAITSALSAPVARLLVARGLLDPQAADRFLQPRLSELGDPFLLPAMDAAVERILRALAQRERIVVFGDYDVDGLTSTAFLVQVLRSLGAEVRPFLPHRMEEGYGLGLDAALRCVEEHQPRLVVTVDCGTGSVEAVLELAKRGVDVVVTDHHAPGAAVAPAVAVVNPKLCEVPEIQPLAGVGVTFKLCHALLKRARERSVPGLEKIDLRAYLDLVALGTIADIVPLTGENRILARHGLRQMNQSPRPGLALLAAKAGIKGPIDAYEVGFRLGPRLNAAGRLGDAEMALELLLGGDATLLEERAEYLDASNRERQQIEAEMVEQALQDAEAEARSTPEAPFAVVVAREGWHPGVVGIVAARLMQRFHRPAIVIALEAEGGRGSCRSIPGFDMVSALAACAGDLRKYGGHAMAAGLEVEPGHLAAFASAFRAEAERRLHGMDLRPEQRIDAWMDLADADERLLAALEQLRPFGMGNTTPVWASAGVRVVGRPRVVGKGHLKLRIASGGIEREAMGWNMGDRELPDGPLDICYQVQRDTYMGRDNVVLNLQDFRASPATSSAAQ